MLKEQFDIASWVAGFLAGTLTEEEEERIRQWKEASGKNRALWERLCRPENFKEVHQMAARYDTDKGWEEMWKKKRTTHYRSLGKYLAYAAVLLLPLAVCILLLERGKEPIATTMQAQRVLPGTPRALLTLADGSVVDLEKADKFELKEKGGMKISKDSSVLNYISDSISVAETKLIYNKIEVPRGGEYSLKLSDGSLVHLNAMSSLRFPVKFSGATREVELEGEAYFEVEKDGKPFIVKTRDMNIRVLGTIFNVSCYHDNDFSTATLVCGSVKVCSGNGKESVVLFPSQQAGWDRHSEKISVKEVDVSIYTAWRNGYFSFKDWRLEDIMTYLSRWYDIQVFYRNPAVKELCFGCSLYRYGEITPILELLEKTGKVSVEVKGKTIIFSSK